MHWLNFTGSVLLQSVISATPLLYAAAGEILVQRSGMVNVGLEGMMLGGAFAASLTAYYTHSTLAGLLAALLAGIVLAMLLGLFTLKIPADQIVIGVVLNLLVLGITGTLYRLLFTQHRLITVQMPLYFHKSLPLLTPCVAPCMLLVGWVLYKTRLGLALRACGENPESAGAAGIRVNLIRFCMLLWGGCMAGMAGAFLSIGNGSAFAENMSAGRGFIALAVVTAGRWTPGGCTLAALIFGFAGVLNFEGQAIGLGARYRALLAHMHLLDAAKHFNLAHIPYNLFLALPYAATLFLLMGTSRSTAAPAALGRPYRRN